jgi:hypothetical protein
MIPNGIGSQNPENHNAKLHRRENHKFLILKDSLTGNQSIARPSNSQDKRKKCGYIHVLSRISSRGLTSPAIQACVTIIT